MTATPKPFPFSAAESFAVSFERLEDRRLMSATSPAGLVSAAPVSLASISAASGVADSPAGVIGQLRGSVTRASYPLPSASWDGRVLHELGGRFIGPVQALRPGAPFYLFDALDVPAGGADRLASSGLPSVRFADAASLSASGARSAARAATSAGELLLLDVSRLRLDVRSSSADVVQNDLERAVRLVDWMKAERPDVQVGLYGAGPLLSPAGGDWTLIKRYLADDAGPRGQWRADHLAWRVANDAVGSLARRVDFLAPSLETAYLDRAGWDAVARGAIAEARRVAPGTPVIAVLGPEVGSGSQYAGRAVPADFWSDQLELAFGYADGAVVAGAPGVATGGGMENHGVAADGRGADWAAATRDFLGRHAPGVAAPLRVPVGGPDAPATEPVVVNAVAEPFRVYDALFSKGKPTTVQLGLSPINYASHGATTDVALKQFADLAAQNGLPLMLNIYETAKIDGRKYDPATVARELKQLEHAIGVISAHQPNADFGFYSVLPIRDYWTPVRVEALRRQVADVGLNKAEFVALGWEGRGYELSGDGKYHAKPHAIKAWRKQLVEAEADEKAWMDANARLARKTGVNGVLVAGGVGSRLPTIYPSIYLFYDEPESNDRYIEAQIREAKKYGGKVLPVIMPQYHESNPTTGRQPIGAEEMARIVASVARAGADGVVLWDGEDAWTPGDASTVAAARDAGARVNADRAAAE